MPAADPRILDEAAHWLARQHASDFGPAEQAALERWRRQSAQHEQVWQRAEHLLQRMNSVPAAIGMAVLDRPRSSRRQMLRAVAVVLATPALGWLAYRQAPWQGWMADYRTATGERRTVTLADGSRMQLNTATAVSVRIDQQARRIRQYTGEILVETSHAPEYAALPLIVQTEDGQMQALGTRFTVRKHERGTTLAVLEGAVRVTPAQASAPVTVQAGEQLLFQGQGAGAAAPIAAQADAWTQGVLYAENQRLQDFLAELGRYRAGVLQCDPGVADLRVSGIFQLRDTDGILALLPHSLPVRVEQRTRYWVTVARR
ncbi:FecR family protein [Comamonas humi]